MIVTDVFEDFSGDQPLLRTVNTTGKVVFVPTEPDRIRFLRSVCAIFKLLLDVSFERAAHCCTLQRQHSHVPINSGGSKC